MNTERFNEIVDEVCDEIRTILASKAEEYAHGDRLSNFKEAASFLQCTPERALLGFTTKHIVCLRDFINLLDKGQCVSREQWKEKTGDIINYMILLDALIEERIQHG